MNATFTFGRSGESAKNVFYQRMLICCFMQEKELLGSLVLLKS